MRSATATGQAFYCSLARMCDTILDEASSPAELGDALQAFSSLCSDIGGVQPNPSFDAWAQDALLDSGVAINPEAAAHCAGDYQRSVVFIRGVHAAINRLKQRFPGTPLEILYAGCGPFATLLLPLLGKFEPGELNISLLDIHQRSLDSVECLLAQPGIRAHRVRTIRNDACHYEHPVKLHLVICETMQKSLEQEPQFAVTANLAPQLWPAGIFIPELIEVTLQLAELGDAVSTDNTPLQPDPAAGAKSPGRHPIATIFTLSPRHAAEQLHGARPNPYTNKLELAPVFVEIPRVDDYTGLDAVLFTRIVVFERYRLGDYDAQITLPLRCPELLPLTSGKRYRVGYQLGTYPRFDFAPVQND